MANMKRDNLTHAVEDYLKTIYDLTRNGERASTNQIAERMGVTPASASGMVQKLAATTPPLLVYEKHHGVFLTEDWQKDSPGDYPLSPPAGALFAEITWLIMGPGSRRGRSPGTCHLAGCS